MVVSIAIAATTIGTAEDPPTRPRYAPGQLLVKFKPEATETERGTARGELSAQRAHTFRSGAEHWTFDTRAGVEEAALALRSHELVEYAEPNYYLTFFATEPGDEFFGDQWGLKNTGQTVNGVSGTADADIDAELAWDVTTGSTNVLVAVIDTGIDYTHPDLEANIWTNPGDSTDDDVDNDENGFVDDIHGWNFACDGSPEECVAELDNDPVDTQGHGTLVTGVIGAEGDNAEGITGVSWNLSVMALKVVPDVGAPMDLEGLVSRAVMAIEYAVLMGADVINISAGTEDFSQTFEDAVRYASHHNVLVVAAAGNSRRDLDHPQTGDVYPAEFDLGQHDGIIAVAATDQNDALWVESSSRGSNYGAQSVDLAAPGANVLSTAMGEIPYEFNSGTSLAAPHVAGVAALLRERNPQFPPELLKQRLLATVDALSALDPNGSTPVLTGGRLNAFTSVNGQDTAAPSAIGNLAATASSWNSVSLSWTATGDDGTTGQAAIYHMRWSTATIGESSFFQANLAGNEPAPASPSTSQSMTVGGLTPATVHYFALKAFDEWGNGPISNVVTCGTNPGACTLSVCRPGGGENFVRCSFLGFTACSTCCAYTCVVDETCTQADPCPVNACAGACS